MHVCSCLRVLMFVCECVRVCECACVHVCVCVRVSFPSPVAQTDFCAELKRHFVTHLLCFWMKGRLNTMSTQISQKTRKEKQPKNKQRQKPWSESAERQQQHVLILRYGAVCLVLKLRVRYSQRLREVSLWYFQLEWLLIQQRKRICLALPPRLLQLLEVLLVPAQTERLIARIECPPAIII